MRNQDIVRHYINAFETRDIDTISAMTAPDIEYHNIPMEVVHGRETFVARQTPFLEKMTGVQWDILAIAEADSGAVLTERVDHFFMADGRRISIRVMGIFELQNGLVARWRDYFDMAEFKPQPAEGEG